MPPTLPGPGGGETQKLVNASNAVPALCRAGLGYRGWGWESSSAGHRWIKEFQSPFSAQ